jgi:hypothetical protein
MATKKEKKVEEKILEDIKEIKEDIKDIKEFEQESNEKQLTSEDMEKYTKIFVYIIVGFILIAIIGFFAFKMPSNFTYHNLEFTKTKEGKIDFYIATLPLKNALGAQVAEMTIDFRNDPRTLKNIQVNTSDKINFVVNKKLYVSLNSPLTKCEDNGIALVNLGRFLATIGQDVKSATANNASATKDFAYITCNNTPTNSVIIVQNGVENKIERKSTNCYEITAKDCDILRVIERFELQILDDAMNA